jgi:HTH-like domain
VTEEEMSQLRLENEILQRERDALKETMSNLRVPSSKKFAFVDANRQLFQIARMCSALDVSVNGYLNWRKRGISQRKREDEQLAKRIEDIYYRSGGSYGSPRIHAELKKQGLHYGRRRIARVMRERNIRAGMKRGV